MWRERIADRFEDFGGDRTGLQMPSEQSRNHIPHVQGFISQQRLAVSLSNGRLWQVVLHNLKDSYCPLVR